MLLTILRSASNCFGEAINGDQSSWNKTDLNGQQWAGHNSEEAEMNVNNGTDPTNHNAEPANTAELKAEHAGMNDLESAEQRASKNQANNHTVLCCAVDFIMT